MGIYDHRRDHIFDYHFLLGLCVYVCVRVCVCEGERERKKSNPNPTRWDTFKEMMGLNQTDIILSVSFKEKRVTTLFHRYSDDFEIDNEHGDPSLTTCLQSISIRRSRIRSIIHLDFKL